MSRKTRKQRGGFTATDRARIQGSIEDSKREQIQHCLSQLKRFAPCIPEQPLRAYQFFYNLGRLQELLKESTHPEIWWKPIEKLLSEQKELGSHIDLLQGLVGIEYDAPTVAKGC